MGDCDLRVLCTNICSLNRDHFHELLLLLSAGESVDIIALSETWIKEDQMKFFNINGYRSFVQPRMDGRRSGGVILYIKEQIIVRNIIRKKLGT